MYAGVPTSPPTVAAGPAAAIARAMPKSVSTTRPSAAMRTLSGLRSLWITPAACALARPAAIACAISTARATEKAPSRAMAAASDSPSTSSMVRNFSPSCSPMS